MKAGFPEKLVGCGGKRKVASVHGSREAASGAIPAPRRANSVSGWMNCRKGFWAGGMGSSKRAGWARGREWEPELEG